jgi:hypothetical protein
MKIPPAGITGPHVAYWWNVVADITAPIQANRGVSWR